MTQNPPLAYFTGVGFFPPTNSELTVALREYSTECFFTLKL